MFSHNLWIVISLLIVSCKFVVGGNDDDDILAINKSQSQYQSSLELPPSPAILPPKELIVETTGKNEVNNNNNNDDRIIMPNDDPNVQNDIYMPSNIPMDLFEKFNIKQAYNTGSGIKSMSGLKTSYSSSGGGGGGYSSSGGGGYSSGGGGGYSSGGGYSTGGGYGSSSSSSSSQCSARPKTPLNSALRCATQTQTCQITCAQDYTFPNGEKSLYLNCVNNKWIIKNSPWIDAPACEPICMPHCLNKGICIQPGECMCPENFVGPRCEHEKRLCLSQPPLPKNSKRTCSSTTCTVSCAKGYRFPDGSSITNMICKDGEWIPTRPELAIIPDCQPVCTPQCQNGGHCLSANICQCPPDYRGPQCQYDAESCAPTKLNFNGAYNCSGNNEAIRCVISCPQGVEFDFAPANSYSCQYEMGIFLPREIPQCKFASNMKVIQSSKTQYKTYNQTSYGSKTKNIYKYQEEDDDQIWRDLVGKIRLMITESETRKRIGGHSIFDKEIDDNYENMILPGVYSLYLKKDVNVVLRTPKPAICMTWNGNKFKTFDGIMYNSDLYCSHTLIQDIVDGSFSLILRSCPYNNNNDNLNDDDDDDDEDDDDDHTRCLNALVLILQNVRFTFENENGIVIVNGPKKRLTIPIQLPGMRVSMVGHSLKIVLDAIGATIIWDVNNLVTIEATANLFNRTAGLCGTMDQNVDNDFISKDGNLHKLPDTFVDAWRAPSIDLEKSKCIMERKNEVLSMDCQESTIQKATDLCSKLLSNPKLSNCIKECDRESLLKTCISDYCYCNDKQNPGKCACDGVSVFAADCRFRGVKLEEGWRDMELCAIPCYNGRIYKSCGPLFEPSCGSATEEFIESCNEGCFCPPGTLQHETKCVRIQDCPCQLRGKTFKAGSEIAKDCNTCKCERGMWKCSDVTCGARCGAIGDPHYVTFDGKRYDFMGKCTYYLMKSDNFSIEAENVACPGAISEAMNYGPTNGLDLPSCTKSVTINVKHEGKMKTIQLKQGRVVLIDGIEIQKLPVRVLHGVLKIRQPSTTLTQVIFHDGLKVWWDGMTRVYIDAPPSYRGKTKGLCGTFNSNIQDDFLTPEGDIESSIESFADKWRTKDTCPFIGKVQVIPHPCQLNLENKAKAMHECAKIKGKIFNECHWSVDPEPYYEDCLYDMCACKGNMAACVCPIFAAYSNECARHGTTVNWRYAVNECAIKCPAGQVFEECGDECFRTCEDLQSNDACKTSCVEGCRCPHGQALDASNECIPIGLCPCTFKGLQFNVGYKEVRPSTKYLELCTCTGPKWTCIEAMDGDKDKYPPAADIRSRCLPTDHEEFTTCEPSEPITCKNMHNYEPSTTVECRPGCICKDGYVWDTTTKHCVLPKDCSCHHGSKSYNDGDKIQNDCNTCKCKSGNWSCTERQCPSVCTSWGDSHFETFDGKDFDFQGVCNYVLSKGSLTGGSHDGFSVTIQNIICGTLGVTCSKSVQIHLTGKYGDSLTLTPDFVIPKSKTNDIEKNTIPSTDSMDKDKINKFVVYRAGIFIIVEVPGMELQVKWDRGTRVYVTLGNRWKGHVQGLCGNNNNDAMDDLRTPSSGIETSSLIFGDSWKLQDFCAKPTEQIDTCQEHPQRKIWSQRKCGILKSDIFSACHSEVPVDKYIKRCTYDACGCDQGGDCECLCTALAAYAYACSMKGVPIKWRTPDLCPMQCDPHCSEYSSCISTCPIETCDNILEQGKDQRTCMEDSCIEGCKIKPCPLNEIYLNDSYTECVPKDICKPVCLEIAGVVFYEGDIMQSDDCQTCVCSRGKQICSGVPCGSTTPGRYEPEYTTSIPPAGDGQVKCISGWTAWINDDRLEVKGTKTKQTKTKIGDTEPLPNYLLLKNLINSASCTYEHMTKIQCRTAITHQDPKTTGDDVECSLEKGLLCAGPCRDYEIRVFCKCYGEIEEFTTRRYGPSSPIVEYEPSSTRGHIDSQTPMKYRESTTPGPIDKDRKKKKKQKGDDDEICDPTIPHVEYPDDCHKFYHCEPQTDMSWAYVEKTCGPSMLFNPIAMVCDWPASVIAIKKECGDVVVTPTIEQTTLLFSKTSTSPWIYTTGLPEEILYKTTPVGLPSGSLNTGMECPFGQILSDCAVPCGRSCHYYFNKYLKTSGECKHSSDICIKGCIKPNSTKSCPKGTLWRDKESCVSISECPCMSFDGSIVKPHATVTENACEICQCIDNAYVCDVSNCEEKKHTYSHLEEIKVAKTTTPIPVVFGSTTEANLLIIPSTVSPPMLCDSQKLVPLIDGKHPLPDSAFNASSYLGGSFKPQYSRLHSKPTDISSGSWSPEINDQMQYLQITLPKLTPVFGVILSGSPLFNQYVTSFKILHSQNGIAFHYLLDNSKTPQIFRGPIQPHEGVKSLFQIPIEAKVIRIYPLTWHDSIAIRAELLGCSKETNEFEFKTTTVKSIIEIHTEPNEELMMCDDPMGLDNGEMQPSQVKFSSSKIPSDVKQSKKMKPFDMLKISSPLKGWRPNLDTPNEYVIFNFLEPKNLTGLVVKGGDYGWVTGINIQYSSDNFIWNKLQNSDGTPKILLGAYDNDSKKVIHFDMPIKAQYMKVVPVQWHDTIEMKIEPLGCFTPYPEVEEEIEVAELESITETLDCGKCEDVPYAPSPIEGICRCYPPLYWNGDECVPKTQCPCMVGHIQYDVGTIFESEDCSQCVCTINGVTQCKPQVCPECGKGLRPVKTTTCNCKCAPCPDGEVICESSGACIPESDWCNGIKDCPDDEVNCIKAPPLIETNQVTNITKVCPPVKCPPGFIVKPSDKKHELKLSAMFQQKTYKHTSTKTSSPKSFKHHKSYNSYNNNNNTILPKPFTINEKLIEVCPEFICIPEKPIITETTPTEPIKCRDPECPKGYDVVLDNIIMVSPNECVKFTCEQAPQKDAVCNVTGRTFNTFDGTEFKYDICNHLLARDLVNGTWSVSVLKNCTAGNYVCHKNLIINDNENGINIKLFTDLSLELDGYRYTVDQLQKSKYSKMNTFVISKVGDTIVFVSHEHGFWVTFDEYGDVKIGVTTRYETTVDGLCGYFNGNPHDDKRLPNGEGVQSTVEFGDGWLNDQSNKEQCEPHACPKELQDQAWELCNAVKHDIFKPCHRVVDVNRFITKCIETTCTCLKGDENKNGGNSEYSTNDVLSENSDLEKSIKECKCEALQPFVRDCLAADENIHLDTWRSIEGCDAKCVAPLIHKDCYKRRCEPSCNSLLTDECPHIPGTCFAGCYCPEGTVRKDDECVPITECKDCICDGFGKSQYLTYDRKNFTFNGNCTYLLTRDVLIENVHTFQVYVTLGSCDEDTDNIQSTKGVKTIKKPKKKSKPSSSSSSCAKALHILFGPHIIHLQKERENTIKTFVDGIEVHTFPLRKNWIEIQEQAAREININLPESQVEIQAIFEDLSFSIRVPSVKYGMKMEGMCGDCNGNPLDDIQLNPNAKNSNVPEDSENINDILSTWLADEPALPKEDASECVSQEEIEMECIPLPPETDPCMKLFDESIFGQCHLIVDPSQYISCCQNDMCKPGSMQEGVCSHFDAYARECARNGICIDWRNTDQTCERSTVCPFGMIYEGCGCPETCETIQNRKSNDTAECSIKHKIEGCVCPKGKVIHDGKCIPENQCHPCDEAGHFVGDKWYPDKCTECECLNTDRKIICTKKECSSMNTICEIGWKQIQINDTNECCPTYKCVPEPIVQKNCTDIQTLPNCAEDQYNKMITDPVTGCSKYICDCKPIDECPPSIKPKLLPGQRLSEDKGGCCPVYKVVCDKSLCPPKLKCTKEFYEPLLMVNSENTIDKSICCDHFICSPPKDKCILEINGRPVLKKPNELWPTDDPCLMQKCTYNVGGLLVVTDELEKCEKSKCGEGYRYEIPIGKCCGHCIQEKCIIGTEIYEPGKIWHSADNCTIYKCEKRNEQFLITSSKETCPDLVDCPEHLRYSKGCCLHCKPMPEAQKNCIASSLSESETIKLVQIFKPMHGKCSNKMAIRGFTECMGTCNSGTKYNRSNFKQDRKCECCSIGNMIDIDVKLTCEDGHEFTSPIAVPQSCSCLPCAEESKMGKLSTYNEIVY